MAGADAATALDDLARSGCPVTKIGHIVAGSGVEVRDAQGRMIDVSHRGWEHFG
jgi:thiamine monophosphate kinase